MDEVPWKNMTMIMLLKCENRKVLDVTLEALGKRKDETMNISLGNRLVSVSLLYISVFGLEEYKKKKKSKLPCTWRLMWRCTRR